MPRVVVLGGGIVGLLAAARHRDAGHDVTLVEAARLGGLLRSEEVAPGRWVDQGTHVPAETGVPELDAWLFGGIDDGWVDHPRLLAGNVFRGRIDERTPFPDLNRLDPAERAAAEAGLLADRPASTESPATAIADLDATFGAGVARTVFEPLIESWYGLPADEVGPGAHKIAANRVVAFTPERTAELKAADPASPLAWHDAAVGASPLHAHYPRSGGCGAWIQQLADGLEGVEVLEGTRAGLGLEGDRVASIELPGRSPEPIDELVTTIPPPLLLLALGLRPPSGPPRMVATRLVDLEVDRPLATTCHYLTVLDADLGGFRITCYPNLRGAAAEGPFLLTVEVLGDGPDLGPDPTAGDLAAHLAGQLERVGVLASGSQLVGSWLRTVPAGFPTPPVGGPDPRAAAMVDALANVTAVGRGVAGNFFLAESLIDAHRRLPGAPA